jgi:glycerol uptake facilitator protein
MEARIFGEFMGTAVLILLGDGVVANVLLKHSKAEGAGWMAITTGWAFAVVFGVLVAIVCGSPDAFLNPAVTLGTAIITGDFSKFGPLATAQVFGAIFGATRLAALSPSLGRNREPGPETGVLFDVPRDP